MKNNLLKAIGINIIIVITESTIGFMSGSMALISDALHNLTDVGSMILSLFGEKVISRKPDGQKTYGYRKTEGIIALVNGLVLIALIAILLFESIQRIAHPEVFDTKKVLLTALLALIGNGLATYFLEKDHKHNLNLKSAWLHSLQDAIFSLGVIIAVIAIHFTNLWIIDPIISIVISLFLLKEAGELIKKSINLLLDSVPENINIADIKTELEKIGGVDKVNDIHIWENGTDKRIFTVHLQRNEKSDITADNIIASVQKLMLEKYKVNHSTIQIVNVNSKMQCEHCN